MTPEQYRQHLAVVMLERDLQDQVIAIAETLGWRWMHHHRSDRSPAGWPDLAMVRQGRLVFAELKRQTGRIAPAQQQWLDDLATVDRATPAVQVHVWRPSDLLDGTITSILT